MTHAADPHFQPVWDAEKMRWVRPAGQVTGIKTAGGEPLKLGFAQFDYLVMPLVLAILLTFAIVYPLVSLDRGGIVPDGLVGTWQTSVPQYANREFRITKTALVFQNGSEEDSVTAHHIRSVESVPQGNNRLYTIRYTRTVSDLKDIYEFSFYNEGLGTIIRFKNQPHIVWRKESDRQRQSTAPRRAPRR